MIGTLFFVPTLVPALMAPSPHALLPATRPCSVRACPRMIAPTPGHLPEMYRARWHRDKDTVTAKPSSQVEIKEVAAQATGAILGVTAIALLGAFKSAALADYTLALTSNAWLGSTYDITPYFVTLTDWVASANSLLSVPMPTMKDIIFACVVTVDLAAFASFVFIASNAIQNERARFAGGVIENEVDELCIVADDDRVCGPVSFDSTAEFACVEQIINGRVQWVCA